MANRRNRFIKHIPGTRKDSGIRALQKMGFPRAYEIWFILLELASERDADLNGGSFKIAESDLLKELEINRRSLPRLIEMFPKYLGIVIETFQEPLPNVCERFGERFINLYQITITNLLLFNTNERVLGSSKNRKEENRKEENKGKVESPKPDPTPPVKIPNPDHKEFVKFYCDEYEKRFGVKYGFDGGKDGAIIKRLLSTHGLSKLKEMAVQYFETDDQFIKGNMGHTIGGFKIKAQLIAESIAPKSEHKMTERELHAKRLKEKYGT